MKSKPKIARKPSRAEAARLRSVANAIGEIDDEALHDLAAGAAALEAFSHALANAPQAALDRQEIGSAFYWASRKLTEDVKKARALLDKALEAARVE